MDGFIALHRGILEWEWYNDINVKVLFIHVLLKANWEDKVWRGINIKRGQYLTSLSTLASETGLTIRQVRVTIEKLKVSGEMTQQSTATYTILEIVNYNKYQTKMTKGGQSNDKPDDIEMTTTNNRINNKSSKEDIIYIAEFSEKFQLKYKEWLLDRKSRKKPVTERAMELQLGKCRKMGEEKSIEAINIAIERGYQSFFEPKESKGGYQKPEKKSLTQMFEENPNFF